MNNMHEITFTIVVKRKCVSPPCPGLREEWLQDCQYGGLEPPITNPFTTVTDLQIVGSEEVSGTFYPSYERAIKGK